MSNLPSDRELKAAVKIAAAGPLRDAYLRLERARLLYIALNDEMREFLGRDELRPLLDTRKTPNGQVITVDRLPAFPPMWGLQVGELVNHLRGALNYVAFQLVSFGTAASDKPRSAQFPIAVHEGEYRRYRARCLPGVDPQWLEVIDRFQPFADDTHPLAVLTDLSDRDRHRIRIPCYARLALPFFELVYESNESLRNVEIRIEGSQAFLSHETRVLRRGSDDRIVFGVVPKTSAYIEGEALFSERLVTIGVVRDIATCVGQILEALAPAFADESKWPYISLGMQNSPRG